MAVGMTLSSREENRSNGAEKSYTFGGGQGWREMGWERLGDERRKLRGRAKKSFPLESPNPVLTSVTRILESLNHAS